MKRALLVLWVGLMAAWAQSHRGLLTVFDSGQTRQTSLHRDMVELLRQKRAEGHFAGTGLEQAFQIYDFAEPQMAASLKRLGLSRSGNYLCLTQLDGKGRPIKVLWRLSYSSAGEALAALDGELGLTPAQPDVSPSPPPTPAAVQDLINSGCELPNGGVLESRSGRYRFVVQTDGNCVVYRMDGSGLVPVWATQTHGGGVRVGLDSRGKMRVLQGVSEIWSTPAYDEGFYQLQIQDDGNLVIYRRSGNAAMPVWASGSR
ncbi:MAG: hypothetical protein U0931_08885 [Vulcanimicrobiota bacterium]